MARTGFVCERAATDKVTGVHVLGTGISHVVGIPARHCAWSACCANVSQSFHDARDVAPSNYQIHTCKRLRTRIIVIDTVTR